MRHNLRHSAVEVACWWVVCWATWLTTQSVITANDALVGAGAALAAGLVATSGRRAAGGRWCWRSSWWQWPAGVFVAVPSETVRVLWRVYRHPRAGGWVQRLRLPREDDAEVSRRAFSALALAASPGAYVIESHDGTTDVHRLVPPTPSWTAVDPSLGEQATS